MINSQRQKPRCRLPAFLQCCAPAIDYTDVFPATCHNRGTGGLQPQDEVIPQHDGPINKCWSLHKSHIVRQLFDRKPFSTSTLRFLTTFPSLLDRSVGGTGGVGCSDVPKGSIIRAGGHRNDWRRPKLSQLLLSSPSRLEPTMLTMGSKLKSTALELESGDVQRGRSPSP